MCLCVAVVRADDYLSEAQRNALLEVQRHLFNDRFDAANTIADSLISANPEDPVGYIYRAAACLGEMTDAEANLYPDLFDSLISTADSLATVALDGTSDRKRAWMHLFRGHATAYRALYESRFGSFTSAVKLGLKVKSPYEQGLVADSTLYDLYGGLGMYHYWKSAKAGILRWLWIFKDDKQKGIDELHLTVDSSLISASVARNALIWIWLDRKDYDSVAAACSEMLKEYPDGKIFRWPLARALSEKGDWHTALEIYELLRSKILSAVGNYFNLVECDYYLYQCFDKLNMTTQAASVAATFLAYYELIPKETKSRQRGKIAFLKRAAKQ